MPKHLTHHYTDVQIALRIIITYHVLLFFWQKFPHKNENIPLRTHTACLQSYEKEIYN